jgi:hypothetical protein
MRKLVFGAIALLVTLGGAAAIAQTTNTPIVSDDGLHHYSIAQKQQSDQEMQAGLQQLQAAQGALSSSLSGATSDLNTAHSDMESALPIYRGNREKSMHHVERAIAALSNERKNSAERADTLVAHAIQFAQAALAIKQGP